MADKQQRVLLDTNVVLDLLLAREPYVTDALQLFAYGETGRLELLLSADAISTVFYIVSKNKNAATAREAISKLLDLVTLAPLDERAVLHAMTLDFSDIEDALVAAVAAACNAEVIVTRNEKDFAKSPVSAMAPRAFLALLQARDSIAGS